jgi:hypothetical protein
MRNSLIAFAGLFMLVGCNSDKVSPENSASAAPAKAATKAQSASCETIKADSMCKEFGPGNIEAAGMDFLKNLCPDNFKAAPCPADKRIGTCATPEGTKVFYSIGGYPIDAAKAQKNCAEGQPAGTWKASS